MVFNRQGEKTGVKGFTYELSGGNGIKAGFFQAGVKENANVWVKQYTSPAAFNAADAKFGSAGQVGGPGVRTQSPGSGSGNSQKNEFFSVHQIPDGTEAGKFAAPGGDISGATFDGTNLWFADRSSGTIYEFSESGTKISEASPPEKDFHGISFDGSYFWSTGRGSATLYQYDSTGSEISSSSLPFSQPRGTAWQGSYVLVANNQSHIYKFTTNGKEISSFAHSSNAVTDLTHDGVYIWVSNFTNGRIDRYDEAGTQIDTFSIPGADAGGLAWTGTYMYGGSRGSDTIYRFTGSASLDLSYQVSGFTILGIPTINATETLGVNEQRSQELDLFRGFTETINFQDADTRLFLKKLETEAIGVNDIYSRTADYFRNLNDGIGLTADYDSNFGVLSGIVYKDSASNPASNAYVFVLEKSSQDFVGAYITNSSGRYSVPSLKEGEEYLVGVDWFDPSDNTFYGEEKSINFTDTD